MRARRHAAGMAEDPRRPMAGQAEETPRHRLTQRPANAPICTRPACYEQRWPRGVGASRRVLWRR
eukprot:4596846-Alexandrium_andersonii.AAC.1